MANSTQVINIEKFVGGKIDTLKRQTERLQNARKSLKSLTLQCESFNCLYTTRSMYSKCLNNVDQNKWLRAQVNFTFMGLANNYPINLKRFFTPQCIYCWCLRPVSTKCVHFYCRKKGRTLASEWAGDVEREREREREELKLNIQVGMKKANHTQSRTLVSVMKSVSISIGIPCKWLFHQQPTIAHLVQSDFVVYMPNEMKIHVNFALAKQNDRMLENDMRKLIFRGMIIVQQVGSIVWYRNDGYT